MSDYPLAKIDRIQARVDKLAAIKARTWWLTRDTPDSELDVWLERPTLVGGVW